MSIAEQLTRVAENVSKVYQAGKDAKENEVWTNIHLETYDYSYVFAGMFWKKSIFKPIKNMRPVIADYMFAAFDYRQREEAVDLVEHLNALGVTLDFSRVTSFTNGFASANISRVGVVDFRKITKSCYGVLACEFMVTIDKLIVAETTIYNKWFANAKVLENLTIEGTIGQNGFSVSSSKLLSKASIESIITALSETTADLTVTLSLTAVNNAFETSEGAADGSKSEEWASLIATKPNWEISLV